MLLGIMRASRTSILYKLVYLAADASGYEPEELPDRSTPRRFESVGDDQNAKCQRAPLSRPTPRRSTPITTTALPFMLRLDTEGVREARLIA